MKIVFTSLLIMLATLVYFIAPSSEEQVIQTTDLIEHATRSQQSTAITKPKASDIVLDDQQTKMTTTEIASNQKVALNLHPINSDNQTPLPEDSAGREPPTNESTIEAKIETTLDDASSSHSEPEHNDTDMQQLPGEEVNFKLKLHSSTHHLIEGRATSDIGKVLFKSRLMPSNEVKLTITLKQTEIDDITLLAYVDLANFTMELDGGNSILNKQHKALMKLTVIHVRATLGPQYEGYDIPEHALMLSQMLAYWSASPEGFIHEKRSIVSQ